MAPESQRTPYANILLHNRRYPAPTLARVAPTLALNISTQRNEFI